jgi:carboxypeptidase C (cathepsin A)
MYLPTLADQILKNQDSIIEEGKLNFQGMLIGNGIMDLGDY